MMANEIFVLVACVYCDVCYNVVMFITVAVLWQDISKLS